MKNNHMKKHNNSEAGIALLLALIALLLISAAAISMIVASGTESSLAGNYRSSSSSYFAAYSGIEEARGRLLPANPNTLAGAAGTGIPPFSTIMPVNNVTYIGNPAPGENLATIMAQYPDNEFDQEFGAGALATTVKFGPIQSISGVNPANIPGPLFKWVRINPVTEKAINADVNGDGVLNNDTPLFYETATNPQTLVVPPVLAAGPLGGIFVGGGGVAPVPPTPLPSGSQYEVLEITALAVLPNGTEKMVQYLTTPLALGLNFTSPLTLGGTVGTFAAASSANYRVNGTDGSGSPPAVPGCVPSATSLPAIGTTAPSDQTYVKSQLTKRPGNYTGGGLSVPSVANVTLPTALQTPQSIDAMLTDIRNAQGTALIPNPPNPPNFNNSGTTYTFGGPGWPTDMSQTNPKIVYVDGSFDLGPNTGYGILVVTGNFTYHGNSGWKGIVLVVGDGTTTFLGNGGGSGEFDGAIFVATTRDASGMQLPALGSVNFDITGGGGNGVYYNSCWIKNVQQPPTYKVLSFREIAYTD